MKEERRWLLGGLLLADDIGATRILTARPKVTEDSRVLLVGDSMAMGLNPHLKELATEAEVPYISLAVPQARIDQWDQSTKLMLVLDGVRPTHVLVSLGTSDALSSIKPDSQRLCLERLLDKLLLGSEVVWIGPPSLPVGANQKMIEMIERRVPNYFDARAFEIPRGPDELHPNAAGYAGWAGALWGWLT